MSYEMISGPVLFAWRHGGRNLLSPFSLILIFFVFALLLLMVSNGCHITGTDRTALSRGKDWRPTGASERLTLLCVTNHVSLGTAAQGAGVREPFLVILELFALKKAGAWHEIRRRVRRDSLQQGNWRQEKRDTGSRVIVVLRVCCLCLILRILQIHLRIILFLISFDLKFLPVLEERLCYSATHFLPYFVCLVYISLPRLPRIRSTPLV